MYFGGVKFRMTAQRGADQLEPLERGLLQHPAALMAANRVKAEKIQRQAVAGDKLRERPDPARVVGHHRAAHHRVRIALAKARRRLAGHRQILFARPGEKSRRGRKIRFVPDFLVADVESGRAEMRRPCPGRLVPRREIIGRRAPGVRRGLQRLPVRSKIPNKAAPRPGWPSRVNWSISVQ